MRVANLPWYDFEELTESTDALWRGIATHMRRAGIADVPDSLDRESGHVDQWRLPELLLSQACGYDVLYDAAADLAVVATPRYSAPGCEGSHYRSAIVVRADDGARTLGDLAGRRCVVNEASSHSGTNALRALVAPLSRNGRFFETVSESGDHATSLAQVAEGRADVACVDVVVLELCRRVRPESLARLRTLGLTELAPAPPFVTARVTAPEDLEKLRRALLAAMSDPDLVAARSALLLEGVDFLEERAYGALVDFEAPALANAYFELPAPNQSPLTTFRLRARQVARSRNGCGVR